jgi:hypothetical protein
LSDQHFVQTSRQGVRRGHGDYLARDVRRGVAFADTDQSFVGVNSYDEGVLGAVGARGVDLADLED